MKSFGFLSKRGSFGYIYISSVNQIAAFWANERVYQLGNIVFGHARALVAGHNTT